MKISRTRGFKISLGNYESVDTSVMVTLGHNDLGIPDEELHSHDSHEIETQLIERVLEILDSQLEAELREVAKLTRNPDSIVAPTTSKKGRRNG